MRDPRTDPKPGDVLIYGPQWQREKVRVDKVTSSVVYCVMGGWIHQYTMAEWNDWMVVAEVLHVAEFEGDK